MASETKLKKRSDLKAAKYYYITIKLREQSHMTSDVFWAFLTYLPTLIRYFTT